MSGNIAGVASGFTGLKEVNAEVVERHTAILCVLCIYTLCPLRWVLWLIRIAPPSRQRGTLEKETQGRVRRGDLKSRNRSDCVIVVRRMGMLTREAGSINLLSRVGRQHACWRPFQRLRQILLLSL